MRNPPLAALLLLTACGDSGRDNREALAADPANRIACAVEGATTFSSSCIVERAAGEDGPILTLHHPSGGFRRLLVTGDGRGVVAADGAEPARVSVIADDRIEVSIAGDSYRLPATIKALRQEQ